MNVYIQYKILYLTFKLLYTTQPPYLYDLISLQTPRNTRLSSVITLARPPTRSSLKITSHSFRYHHPTSGINFLTHFVNHVLICLFLIHLFSTIISPRECYHHHSYHPSSRHSSIPNSKLSYSSNPTLHRHLAPLRTDFTDTRTALRFFSVSVFFLVFS